MVYGPKPPSAGCCVGDAYSISQNWYDDAFYDKCAGFKTKELCRPEKAHCDWDCEELIIPAAIGTLAALKSVRIDDVDLTKLVPELAKLTSLKSLDLRQSSFATFPDFSALVELTELQLNGNTFTKIDAAVISKLTKLEILILDSNEIDEIPIEVATKLPALRYLSFSSNKIAKILPELDQLSKLTHLYLDNNDGMTGEFPKDLCGATRFKICYAATDNDVVAPRDTRDCCDLPYVAPLDTSKSCPSIADESTCVASADASSGSPCTWCCGDACTSGSAAKCEPLAWLEKQTDQYKLICPAPAPAGRRRRCARRRR